jgi:putative DNA methylase
MPPVTSFTARPVPSDEAPTLDSMAVCTLRPAGTVLARINWSALGERARHEQRNRECYTPAISVFRWWARRPHAVVGAILDAARDGDEGELRVSDPFSGGGTVALEAARRDMPVVAQDLHPWAVVGLQTVLNGVDSGVLKQAAADLLSELELLREEFYGVACPKHGEISEVAHAFWVRKRECPQCARHVFLYPYGLVSLASRAKEEQFGYFGCSGCGAVTRSALAARERRCRICHRRLPPPDCALTRDRQARCRHCEHLFSFSPASGPTAWELALVQRVCRTAEHVCLHLDYPTEADIAHADVSVGEVPDPLEQEIPSGLETGVLRRTGFRRWRDLYPPRQLETLLRAACIVRTRGDLPEAVRQRLLVAICGASEMAGYLSRWDRYYPKAFEAIANHRFSSVGLSVETNLLGPRGRGTLPRRFRASVRAAEWVDENVPEQAREAPILRRRRPGLPIPSRTTLACRSSERQFAPDGAVDIVLTDPPYFDDVQYAELASLFLVWAQGTGVVPASVRVDLQREAVPNSVRGTSGRDYARSLRKILAETRRTLREGGVLILTFHNTDLAAWTALGGALRANDFGVTALAVVHAENERDHAKRAGRGFTKDLVIECRVGVAGREPTVVWSSDDPQDRELVAAGLALARSQGNRLSDVASAYYAECDRLALTDRRIAERGRVRERGAEDGND